MDAYNFDKCTRAFARPANRRRLIAAVGGLLGLSAVRRAHAVPSGQLTPDACASTGQVCTLLRGCCSGLSCATSAINPSYGVCVPGDGGMVSAGTALVVPFDEEDAATAAPVTEDTSTTTTTDPQAEREQELAERRSRRQSHRNEVQARKDDQRDRKEEQQERRRGPRLSVDLLTGSLGEERLAIRNLSDTSVLLTKVNLASNTTDGSFLDETLSIGESFFLISGMALDAEVDANEFVWRQQHVCENNRDESIVLSASFSSEALNKNFILSCADGDVDESVSGRRRKRNRNNRNDNRKRKHSKRSKKKRNKQ